jgi:hypothetical protein
MITCDYRISQTGCPISPWFWEKWGFSLGARKPALSLPKGGNAALVGIFEFAPATASS